mmetsp:Transcript_9340/g.33009  ORF Transcript_9340/g.33009 Transcript_9340/m.33009 type:complete len:316 (+) Transcript_9340:166-1113(+)
MSICRHINNNTSIIAGPAYGTCKPPTRGGGCGGGGGGGSAPLKQESSTGSRIVHELAGLDDLCERPSGICSEYRKFAALYDLALCRDDGHPLTLLDQRQAVRHDQGCRTTGSGRQHSLGQLRCRGGVQSGGRLVEQQDRRPARQDPGQRQSLALASGEEGAGEADGRRVRPLPGNNETMSTSRSRRLFHVCRRSCGRRLAQAERDRIMHGLPEQGGVLRGDAELGPQVIQRHCLDVLTIDKNAPALRIKIAKQKGQSCGFARSRGSHQRTSGTSLHIQSEASQHLLAHGLVLEVDIIEADRQSGRWHWHLRKRHR